MSINKCFLLIILFCCVNKTYLNGQVQLGLFSHSEFFYAPNESHYGEKSFYTGYNKSNLSSHLGASIGFKLNHKFSLSIGAQRVNRDFNCNCVNTIITTRNVYYIGNGNCELQLTSKYKVLQVPFSVKYTFRSNEKFAHSIGIGNTVVYSLKRENLLYDSLGALDVTYSRKFLSVFSPEVYYDLSVHLFNHTYANLSLGIREELSNQWNHAFFAKVGMSYSFEKDKPKRRRRR